MILCRYWTCTGVRKSVFLTLLLLLPILAYSQYTIHGTVSDIKTGEYLVSANVFDAQTLKGTVSNEYGFYSLKSASNSVELTCSYIGCKSFSQQITLTNDTVINIALNPELEIDELTIRSSSRETDAFSSQMSAHNINRIKLKTLPTLLGETDLVKALQYLPGVSSGTEGTSGIYVRGGGSDQNLILLDGVPVYNVNHLFGFFSVFNGDAVNRATLYKAGFPARYSGRLSSVIDVGLKEGNMKEFHGSASVGIISSKIMLEGPIKKDKTSFMISGRRTYADIMSYPVQYIINKRNKSDAYVGYFFYDLNAKINHKFSDRSRLYFSSYMGKDEFYMNDYNTIPDPGNPTENLKLVYNTGFNWGNITSALRWNYIWGKKLFSNITLSYSTYKFRNFDNDESLMQYSTINQEIENEYNLYTSNELYYSGIKDLSSRINFSYIPSTNQFIRFGVKATRYMFEPGIMNNEYIIESGKMNGTYIMEGLGPRFSKEGADTVNATEVTAFIEDDFSIGDRFKSNIGVSTTAFLVDGKTYYSFEPRISARFKITDNLVYKASYAKMSQNIHLLTNSMIGLPTDIWVPTTKEIIPEESWQVASGFKYILGSNWEFSIEVFYKDLQNLVEYAEGADILVNGSNWESKIETGSGTVYGAEFFAEKTYGRWTGSMGYTWSKNMRTFENISFGEPFPYKYDRRHDLSVVVNYKINDRVSMGGVWVYGSGIHTTILDQSYLDPFEILEDRQSVLFDKYGPDIVKNFEVRNGYQLPAYHRLDLGINFEKEKKSFVRTWSFGAYNAYNRKNAFFIESGTEFTPPDVYEKKVYQTTMFPIMPYLRYSITF
jgi:outer membrane receptor for ferrienterochelin and colicin